MKIGIITLPLHYNYGGILQAYALQKVIHDMGHEVCTLNRPLNYAHLKWPKGLYVLFKRIIRKYVFRKPQIIFIEKYVNKTLPIVSKNTLAFVNKYINLCRLKDLSKLKENDYDAYIVGSDQIWRKYVLNIEHCFLSFTKGWNVKRISYAASFGADVWQYSPKVTKRLKEYIQWFDKVSVREKQAQRLCENHLGFKPDIMIDPTFLLAKEEYLALIPNQVKSAGNLLCYILDEDGRKWQLINEIAKDKALKPFKVNSKVENLYAPLNERLQPSVEQWLRGFQDAEFVATDSFHACVFAIIFAKPFIVFGNNKRGNSRFETLLGLFGLENRLISDLADYKLVKDLPLPLEKISVVLSEKRKEAMTFLHEGLDI